MDVGTPSICCLWKSLLGGLALEGAAMRLNEFMKGNLLAGNARAGLGWATPAAESCSTSGIFHCQG